MLSTGLHLTSESTAGEERVLAAENHRPFIQPVSGLRSRFIIAGTRCTADAYGCITARSGTARG